MSAVLSRIPQPLSSASRMRSTMIAVPRSRNDHRMRFVVEGIELRPLDIIPAPTKQRFDDPTLRREVDTLNEGPVGRSRGSKRLATEGSGRVQYCLAVYLN